MYKELIDSFIAENKDDHEALQAIEAFLHECDQYVRKETMCGHRERFEGGEIPFTDTTDLEKAYEAVKKHGFSLPEDNKAQKEAQGAKAKKAKPGQVKGNGQEQSEFPLMCAATTMHR